MKLVIKNNSGQYWTGKCFGVEQTAEKYNSIEDLPDTLDNLTQETWCTDPENMDIRYYGNNLDAPEAGVYTI